jgi:competence protein ComEC
VKLPVLAITAAFACGIALGLWEPLARYATSRIFLAIGLSLATLLIIFGIALARGGQLWLGGSAALISWLFLGIVSGWIAEQPRASNHIIALMEHNQVVLTTPLTWHGRLRDEPAKLPWGYGLEIDLTGVNFRGALVRAEGGLRLSFAPSEGETLPASLHAGDEITVVAQAKRPQVFRDEGAFDRRAYLATQNIDLVATLRAPELLRYMAASRATLQSAISRVRRRLRDELDSLFASKPEVAAILRAMLLGDRSFVDRNEATDFQKTGVFHVLVVAGLHVGALAVSLFWIGRKMRLTPGWTILFTLSILLAYVAVVEQRPPVLRASVMVSLVVLGGYFYRRLELLNSAALAALILLVARPLALRDSSFQLTFLAIGCIGGLALPWLAHSVEPYAKALRGWRDVTRDATHEPRAAQFRIDLRSLARWLSGRVPQKIAASSENSLVGGIAFSFRLWELLVLTVALQIGMLPLMARDFHRITLSAPFVNLAVVPLTGIVVPLGFLTVGTSLVFPLLGRILALPLSWATLLLVTVVHWFAALPHWSYRIPGPQWWLVVLFFTSAVSLAVAIGLIGTWSQRVRAGSTALLAGCALLIAMFPFSPQWSPGKLELTVLDVGQGDSLFVVSPHGRTLLIDGGGSFGGFSGQEQRVGIDPGEEVVSAYLWSRGYKKIDTVALTHAHQDHVGGLIAILQNFRVGRLWIGREVASPVLAKLEALAKAQKVPLEHQARGSRFKWDAVDGEFLWPDVPSLEPSPFAKNDDSLVLYLRYGLRSILLPGDAERTAEHEMLADTRAEGLHADILKIGHHGSKNSTTPEFLAAARPTLAIISAGEDNPYGHPNPELLERLHQAGVRILRTDQDGAVQILTDGSEIRVACFNGCPEVAQEISAQAQTPNHEQNNKHQ